MEEDTQKEVVDETTLEEDFNKALEDLSKSLELDEDLEKAKKPKKVSPDDDEDNEPESEDSDEDGSIDEDEEDEDVKKSLDDWMNEDEDAEAAMDVEPFLRQLVKSLTTVIENNRVAQEAKIAKLEKLVKSQGKLLTVQAKLQKSVAEQTEKIAKTPLPISSVRSLQKSRFAEDLPEMTGMQVLNKSREWLQSNKITLLEAGKIEGRVNSGSLGQQKDALDMKVMSLLKEAK